MRKGRCHSIVADIKFSLDLIASALHPFMSYLNKSRFSKRIHWFVDQSKLSESQSSALSLLPSSVVSVHST